MKINFVNNLLNLIFYIIIIPDIYFAEGSESCQEFVIMDEILKTPCRNFHELRKLNQRLSESHNSRSALKRELLNCVHPSNNAKCNKKVVRSLMMLTGTTKMIIIIISMNISFQH